MSWARKHQETKMAETATRRGACLTAGPAIGGALIAWGRLMHPLLGALLWFTAFALVWYGIPWLTAESWKLRRLLRTVALIVATSFFYVTSQHAEMRIVQARLLAKGGAPNDVTLGPTNVGIALHVKNDGGWRALYAPAQGMQLIAGDTRPLQRRALEESLYQMVGATRFTTEPYELAEGYETTLPLRITVTPEQRVAFDEQRAALLVVVQLRFRDWSPKEEVIELCRIIPASGPSLDCARHNGPRQTWWLFQR